MGDGSKRKDSDKRESGPMDRSAEPGRCPDCGGIWNQHRVDCPRPK